MATSGAFVRLQTQRRDAWWTEILPVIAVMGSFTVYATFRAFEGKFYEAGPYLSPFYSPLIDPHHRWWPYSPALLILMLPLGFRGTCYYYRRALYRAFMFDPPACAVGELHQGTYQGENAFPFILQNVHRYFFLFTMIFLGFLWYDVFQAFRWEGHWHIGIGSLVMLTNVCLLSLYSFGCHSFRHLVGGKLDCFSCANYGSVRLDTWKRVTWLNERHMLFAWSSLFSVGLTDFYIRLVATGAIRDIRIL